MSARVYDILIIDDEPVITEAVDRICSSEGYEVETASDGRTGLDRVKTHTHKAIICDIMMPDMDGFEFLTELRKHKIDTPVIMSTGFSTLDNAVRSLRDGAIDFVPKPFTVDELLSSISRAFKYGEIYDLVRKTGSQITAGSLPYVPCPSRYFRLGYRSWVVTDNDGTAQIGVTDLFVKTAGDLKGIDMLRINEEVVQGSACADLLTLDGLTHKVLSPLSGRIVDKNDQLLKNVSLIEKDPYFVGWFYRIIPSDLDYEFKHLMACSSDRI